MTWFNNLCCLIYLVLLFRHIFDFFSWNHGHRFGNFPIVCGDYVKLKKVYQKVLVVGLIPWNLCAMHTIFRLLSILWVLEHLFKLPFYFFYLLLPWKETHPFILSPLFSFFSLLSKLQDVFKIILINFPEKTTQLLILNFRKYFIA